jgi:exportin-1
MHETFQGVQDFACETFLKISMKCGRCFIITNEKDGENEPYINTLVRTVQDDTKDLEPHQKLMFYEALGNMITYENDINQRITIISQLMQSTYNNWIEIFNNAGQNSDFLKNYQIARSLELIVRINERVCFSTKTPYWKFGCNLYNNMLNTFEFYSNIIDNSFNNNIPIDINLKSFMGFNRTLLKFFITLVGNINDPNIIINEILNGLGKLIIIYNNSHINNKDPNTLLIFAKVLEQLKNINYDYISTIWNSLCIYTLNMIKNDFQSFPEHRMNFFILLKSLISNAFDSIFKIQQNNFNKDIIDAILWAIKHETPIMYETGLETMKILIEKIATVKMVNGINICDLFFGAYYFSIFIDVFVAMTDSFHKNGFKLQVEIIQLLIQIIEMNVIKENLFSEINNVNNNNVNNNVNNNLSNKNYFLNKLTNDIANGFKNLNQNQIEAFCLGLFNKSYNYHDFKQLIRDFLINLKSFAGNNNELYIEEKNKEIEEAKKIMQAKMNLIPGLSSMYDQEVLNKISSNNYLNNDNNNNNSNNNNTNNGGDVMM